MPVCGLCGKLTSRNFFNSQSVGWVQLSPLGTSATNWPIVLAQGDCENGEFGGIKIIRRNRSTRRKPAQRHFVHHKSHLTRPGREPGPPRWEACG
jgi:hypothetical protein